MNILIKTLYGSDPVFLEFSQVRTERLVLMQYGGAETLRGPDVLPQGPTSKATLCFDLAPAGPSALTLSPVSLWGPRGRKDAALVQAPISAATTHGRAQLLLLSPSLCFPPFLPHIPHLCSSLLYQVICSLKKHSWEFAVSFQTGKSVNWKLHISLVPVAVPQQAS